MQLKSAWGLGCLCLSLSVALNVVHAEGHKAVSKKYGGADENSYKYPGEQLSVERKNEIVNQVGVIHCPEDRVSVVIKHLPPGGLSASKKIFQTECIESSTASIIEASWKSMISVAKTQNEYVEFDALTGMPIGITTTQQVKLEQAETALKLCQENSTQPARSNSSNQKNIQQIHSTLKQTKESAVEAR